MLELRSPDPVLSGGVVGLQRRVVPTVPWARTRCRCTLQSHAPQLSPVTVRRRVVGLHCRVEPPPSGPDT
eukprot:5524573-Prymnesium_polylepis.1